MGRQGSRKHPIGAAKGKTNQGEESGVRDLWDKAKHNNLLSTGTAGGGERQGAESPREDGMAENLPPLAKGTDPRGQEAQRVPHKVRPKRPSPDTELKRQRLKTGEHLESSQRKTVIGLARKFISFFFPFDSII